MKTLANILILITFGFFNSFAQNLDKNYVDNWVRETFPEAKIDTNVIYILNGIMIDSDTLDATLSRYNRNDLTTINFLDKILNDNVIVCGQIKGIVLMISKGQQSKKSIKNDLKTAKEKFKKSSLRTTSDINPKDGEPVLIINGKQIFFKDCYEEINNINTNDLIGINIIDKPVSKEIYGTNGVNGLIIITTKD
jgi:hypothetical protein